MRHSCALPAAIFLFIMCGVHSDSFAEKVVYAAGENNTFLRLRDGVWESVYREITTADLKCVWESPDGEVFAAGSAGVIIHFDHSEWEVMDSGSTAELRQIWGTGSEDLFIVGSGGEIFHYDGAAWSLQYTAPVPLHAIWGFSGDNIYACGGYANILHYDGVSWEIVHSTPDSWRTLNVILAWTPDSLNIMGDNDSYYSEEYYNCFHFDGDDWTEIPFPRIPFLLGYQNIPPDTVLYYGEGGIALNDGTGWEGVASACIVPYCNPISGPVWVSPEGGIHGVYTDGYFHNTYFCNLTNGSCMKSGNPLATSINAIHGRSDDEVWAVGDDGLVLKFDGQNWNLVLGRLSGCFFGGIYGSNPSDIWLGGCSNILVHFNGESIGMVDFSPSQFVNIDNSSTIYRRIVDVHGLSASDIVCCAKYPQYGDDLDITVGRFDGSSWSPINGPSGWSGLSKVCNLPGGIVILTGSVWNPVDRIDESRIIRYDGSWTDISRDMCHEMGYYCDSYPGDFNTPGSIAFTLGYVFNPIYGSGNCIYSVGNTGLPSQYSDPLSGTYYGIWGTLVADQDGIKRSNFWLAGANGMIDHHIHGIQDTVYSSGTSNTLKAVWGFSRDDIYAVGLGGAIVHFDGDTWSVMDSGTPDDLLAVWGAENTVATLLQSFSAELLGGRLLVKWEMAECDPLVEFRLTRKEIPGSSIKEIDGKEIVRNGNLISYLDTDIVSGNKYIYTAEYLRNGEPGFLFEIESPEIPGAVLSLNGIYPNPFNPNTTIEYSLPARCHVGLEIYDIAGRLVAVLRDEIQDAGIHRLTWNGRTGDGHTVSSGVYFCRLKAGKDTISRKLVLTR